MNKTTNESIADIIMSDTMNGNVIKKQSTVKVRNLEVAKDIIVSLSEKGYYCVLKERVLYYKIDVYVKIDRADITRLSIVDDTTRNSLGVPYETNYTDDE